MQAKWAQLRRAMPPRDSTAEQDDEGLKLGGKEQSKATCCRKPKWKTFLAVTDNGSLGTTD